LERADQRLGLHGARAQRTCQPEQVIPVVNDQLRADGMAREVIEHPIVGRPVDAPQAGGPDVAQPRAELEAQEPEESEHAVGIRPGIRHNLRRLKRGLLAQQEA
jgi:hypothetical protein